MALSVPLARFTSQVGGGSAFYVRPHSHTFMKILLAALSGSSSGFLVLLLIIAAAAAMASRNRKKG